MSMALYSRRSYALAAANFPTTDGPFSEAPIDLTGCCAEDKHNRVPQPAALFDQMNVDRGRPQSYVAKLELPSQFSVCPTISTRPPSRDAAVGDHSLPLLNRLC